MTKPIRILHVIGLMDRGGAETLIMNLYRSIDRNLVQFDFVENRATEGAYDQEILSLGGHIYRCPHYNGRNHFPYVKWWDHFFRDHSGDYSAVHGHLGSTAAIYLGMAKKYGLYTIAHSHNTNHFSLRDLLYSVYSYPTRFVADFFFGCSLQAGIDRYGVKIASDPSRYKTVPNAIHTGSFSYDPTVRDSLRQELGIADRIVIGHVGRFSEQKNHRFLINIFSEIHKKKPNTCLLLVGDGPLRSEMEQQVAQLQLTACTVFAGVQDDVSRFYQAMDAFVFPSIYEGFGIVALEAQASGLPCFLSDVIPDDCVVTDLVCKLPLRESATTWADQILSGIRRKRSDHSFQVAASGFDINETAKWLTDFYMKISG